MWDSKLSYFAIAKAKEESMETGKFWRAHNNHISRIFPHLVIYALIYSFVVLQGTGPWARYLGYKVCLAKYLPCEDTQFGHMLEVSSQGYEAVVPWRLRAWFGTPCCISPLTVVGFHQYMAQVFMQVKWENTFPLWPGTTLRLTNMEPVVESISPVVSKKEQPWQ